VTRKPARRGRSDGVTLGDRAQIQQRAMDQFLRLCLVSSAAVKLLLNEFQPSATSA